LNNGGGPKGLDGGIDDEGRLDGLSGKTPPKGRIIVRHGKRMAGGIRMVGNRMGVDGSDEVDGGSDFCVSAQVVVQEGMRTMNVLAHLCKTLQVRSSNRTVFTFLA
jgi:hypothetical protein